MANNLGDFDTSAVVYGKFSTFRPTTGATFTLGGTPALSVYKDNSTTQSTTGVTLTADFDSVTGLNHFAIDTSADGTFYSSGSFFDIVITTGSVDSVSVTGSVVGSFTLRKNSSLKPTTASRTLDVSAGGEAGLDWANVGSPTTSLALTGTTIAATQKVDVDTIKTNPVVNGGTITFPTTATLASTTNITAGTVGSVTGAVGSVTGDIGGNVVGSVASVVGAVGSVTGLTASNLDATVSSRMATYTQPTGFLAATFPASVASPTNITSIVGDITGNLSGSVGGVTGLTASDVGAIKDKTDRLTFTVPGFADVNIQYVNDVLVSGDGSGTPWGP